MWHPVRTKYRATRLRYVALCGVGVLQVLRCSRRGGEVVGMRYPTIPGILWNLHKQVPYGIQVCQDLRTRYRATRLRYVALCGVA